jgi:GT2 family glycosyltransferase
VAETDAQNLLFLDADCVPAPGWLARALELAGEDRVVGGRVDTFDETPPPRSGAEAFEEVFAFRMQMYIDKKGFSGTGNLLTTRRVFEAAGPMVPGLSEDMDWCFRATGAGYPLVYDDRLAVGHPTRQDWPALKRKWRRTSDEGFYLNGTGFAARLRWSVRAFAVLGSSILHLPVILTSPKLRNGLERRRAAGTLIRLRAQRCAWMLMQASGCDCVNR